MPSLLDALAQIGEPASSPLSIPSSFGGRTGSSLRTAMEGMTDPRVTDWHEVGTALKSENTSLSEETQGAATDGRLWYVCSNAAKSVVAFSEEAERVAVFEPSRGIWDQLGGGALSRVVTAANVHFGAPGYFDGRLYVPTQSPHGVWRFRANGTEHVWRRAPEPAPAGNLFAWCAVHPFTHLLYTCSYDKPTHLYAYDSEVLARRPAADLPLARAGSIALANVQGAVFTRRGRIILVRSGDNAVFCYSGLNGHFFGAKSLGDFGSIGSEVESVAIRAWQFSGTPAQVHILELDNDWPDKDDFYLHSFQVPDPTTL